MKRVFPHTKKNTHTHLYGARRPKKQLITELMINQCVFPVRYELMLKKQLNFKHILQLSTDFSTSMGENNIDKSKESPSELT
jgi:hypothetical protein